MSIELKHVTKIYDKRVLAVDNASFRVEEGEYACILGPSGCGKTTLLKLIAGLIEPTKGEVLIRGIPSEKVPPEDRGIAMVFQNFAIFPHMDVYDNVAFGPRLQHLDEDTVEERVNWALELVHLTEKADYMPEELSAPELQRVGIARALATRSQILLLDEPLGALDEKIQIEFRREIRHIVKKLGLTCVHITHNQEEAMEVADKIILVRKGRIQQVGTPSEVYRKPKRPFVANLLGETNFLSGTVLECNDPCARINVPALGDIYGRTNRHLLAGDRALISFRHEHLLPEQFYEEGDNIFEGVIRDSVFSGRFKMYELILKSRDIIESKTPILIDPNYKVGDKAKFIVKREDIRVFKYPENLNEELALE